MRWFGFGTKKLSQEEVADSVAKLTFGTLAGIVSRRLVPDVIRVGSKLDAASITRECYYLLQFGTSLALLRASEPGVATGILQRVADAMTVKLHEAGFWPIETSVSLAEEYFTRREEFVRTVEGLPDDEIEEGIEVVLAHSAMSVAGRHLQLPKGPRSAGIYGALVALANEHFRSVTTLMKTVSSALT